jgi:formylglycine-generating enzyme required for sulfatase activity
MTTIVNGDRIIDTAREVLALDRAGLPVCHDSHRILTCLQELGRMADEDATDELVTHGFLIHAGDRYHTHIEPHLRAVNGGQFQMGTEAGRERHFCGETPRHTVDLSSFMISQYTVTDHLFALMNPRAHDALTAKSIPVVDVTWFDAAVFAAWMGCRLPTEAEWEFACGAGTAEEWCCPESELRRHCWYSENAGGHVHAVGTTEPNALGIFDMHGNVWEWCQDRYAADFYARSPRSDPVYDECTKAVLVDTHRVSRGGSFLSLSEMCRIRYRLHDPAAYWSSDLGFRLVANLQ